MRSLINIPHRYTTTKHLTPAGPEHDEVRYLRWPFDGIELGGLESTRVTFSFDAAWERGVAPY